ncbi:hypothetical protein CEXT_171211 [Caerostris extrusa]|uniref:Uncharacterized protein n=1 Tax=Caerostris extrusa TaxID=172846 RepID=A0AAV4YDC0_CAEEX|nr:hypothetical protein CEXT_171211 [Caerostris extrusa]
MRIPIILFVTPFLLDDLSPFPSRQEEKDLSLIQHSDLCLGKISGKKNEPSPIFFYPTKTNNKVPLQNENNLSPCPSRRKGLSRKRIQDKPGAGSDKPGKDPLFRKENRCTPATENAFLCKT